MIVSLSGPPVIVFQALPFFIEIHGVRLLLRLLGLLGWRVIRIQAVFLY